MHCTILAVGQKMPNWCKIACEDYALRLQRMLKCSLVEIPPALRNKSNHIQTYKEDEFKKIQQKILPGDLVIALDCKGESWTTPQLSQKIAKWQLEGNNLCFVIGGPDGLDKACLDRANTKWSLSPLTFPHMMVRVILFEQLYRAASMLSNHPYHRE